MIIMGTLYFGLAIAVSGFKNLNHRKLVRPSDSRCCGKCQKITERHGRSCHFFNFRPQLLLSPYRQFDWILTFLGLSISGEIKEREAMRSEMVAGKGIGIGDVAGLNEVEEKVRGKHFVLVHGSCHGAWCWYKLADLLEQSGHVVTALDMAGAGIDQKNADKIRTLAEYNQPLADFINTLPHKVILVGHSFGGVNLSCTMDQFPHKIDAAVFVGAFMPLSGTPHLQLIDEVHQRVQTWGDSEFNYEHDGQQSRLSSFKLGIEFTKEFMYDKSPSEDITLAQMLLRSFPCLEGELEYSSENYSKIPRAYVVTKQDKTICEELQRKMISENPPDRVYELEESDHSPFFSCPAQLAHILNEIASAFS